MKFIHISDTHFGKIYKKIGDSAVKILENERRRRFHYVIDYAIDNEIEFIVHSGDLFDNDHPDYMDIIFVRSALKKLKNNNIDFYFIRGNHDKKDGLLFEGLDNVYEFSNQEVTIYEREDCFIHGISHMENDVRNPIKFFNRLEGKANIGLLHSNVQSSNYENYMPVSLNELKSLRFDYMALGHIHKPEVLYDNIVYAGSLCPISKKDIGVRGFFEVEIFNGVFSRFVEIEGLIFTKHVLENVTLEDVEKFLYEQDSNQIVELNIIGHMEHEEYKRIKAYLDNVILDNHFVDFSYSFDINYTDAIVHPMYDIVVKNLKNKEFLENCEFEYLENYDYYKDINENYDDIKKMIDNLFRR